MTDPTLSESLASILSWVEQAGAFVEEQAPLYCQEVLAWSRFSNGVGFVVCLLVMVATPLIVKAIRKKAGGDEDILIPTYMFGALFFVSASVGAIVTASYAAKTYVAPRMVIVEHIQKAIP